MQYYPTSRLAGLQKTPCCFGFVSRVDSYFCFSLLTLHHSNLVLAAMVTVEAPAAPNSLMFGSQKVGVDHAKEDVTPCPEYALFFKFLFYFQFLKKI
jgi:hypothetical protein